MDHYATLHGSVESVFAHLAAPARLGDWLGDVSRVDADPDAPIGFGTTFAVTLRRTGGELVVEAEVIAHEPPWLVEYRLVHPDPWVLRLTCTADRGQTSLHVHQTDRVDALVVDLARLARALAVAGPGIFGSATPQSLFEKDF